MLGNISENYRHLSLSHPVFLTDTASILQVSSPGEAESSSLEVSVGEHVGEAEVVVIFLCNVLRLIIHNIYSKIIHLKKFPRTFPLHNFPGIGSSDLLVLLVNEPLFF